MAPLGIVAALRSEVAPALRDLKASVVVCGGLPCYETPGFRLILSGVGHRRADRAARLLADAGPLDALVSAGFAGALSDELRPGDLVLGGSADFPADPALLERLVSTTPCRRGASAAVDAVLNDAAGKADLARRSGALVVDMESGAVGAVARERSLPFLCAKVVLDTPSAPLASRYDGCLPVLAALLFRPGGVLRDARRSRIAAERLRAFLVPLSRR